MKRSSISGWKEVFTYTLTQTLKSKAFIVSYIIFIALAIISMPLVNVFLSSATETKTVTNLVKKVYVNNETALPDIDFTGLLNGDMSSISFTKMQEDYDTVAGRIDSSEQDSVILTISDKDGMYSLALVKASKGPVSKTNLQQLGTAISEQFETFRINTLGITQDQVAMLNAPVTTTVSMTDTNGVPIVKEDTSISGSEYGFIYGTLFIILMITMMGGSQIATSIVTEKSTRVIEYLLISIRPLALIVGKVLAMLVAVLLQMGSMVAVLFVSNIVTARLSTGGGQSVMAKYLPSNIFENLNIVNIIFCFLLMLLGLIFYAVLAGLAGATVSKLEEIQEGLTLFSLVSVVGAYVGLGAANVMLASGMNTYVIFALMFPLSAPFILPGAFLVGKASLMIVIIATALQIVFIILLFLFVAKVFETLILHNGNKIKIKDLIKIFKTA